MTTELSKNYDPIAEGLKDILVSFRTEHPHVTNLIIYSAIMLVGGVGVVNEIIKIKG